MTEPTHGNPLVDAYHRMMERVKLRLEELEHANKRRCLDCAPVLNMRRKKRWNWVS